MSMKFNCDDCCYDINRPIKTVQESHSNVKTAPPSKMLLTLYSLPEILFLKRHGLKGLYSWGVSWGVAYVPTMQLKKLATMLLRMNNSWQYEWTICGGPLDRTVHTIL